MTEKSTNQSPPHTLHPSDLLNRVRYMIADLDRDHAKGPLVDEELIRSLKKAEDVLSKVDSLGNSDDNKWDVYQKIVHKMLDSFFKKCQEYELINDTSKVSQCRMVFEKYLREFLRIGKFNRHVEQCPHGYQGDFEIIDLIYKNNAGDKGVARCLNAYFLTTPASVATRNRKESFKRYLKELITKSENEPTLILNLASGPARDIAEILNHDDVKKRNFRIDCVDHDQKAIDYAKGTLGPGADKYVRFIKVDAIRLAVVKDPHRFFKDEYDLIFSTGLFDYLNDELSIRLISNLKRLLKPNGELVISNYRDKQHNPSRLYMEWGGAWALYYRTEVEFLNLFKAAGFPESALSLRFEEQGIMQYCFARNIS